MTAITFYTPTYKRPRLLAQCRESVALQSDRDSQHLVIVDEVGLGIDGMFAAIPTHTGEIAGDYVYVLQDDDVLADRDVVAEFKRFVHEHDEPPVVIVRNDKAQYGVQPTLWQQEPRLGCIDLGSYIVRADVFRAHADQFGRAYSGDFPFIHYLWSAGYEFAWWDRMFAVAQQIGLGRPERV